MNTRDKVSTPLVPDLFNSLNGFHCFHFYRRFGFVTQRFWVVTREVIQWRLLITLTLLPLRKTLFTSNLMKVLGTVDK